MVHRVPAWVQRIWPAYTWQQPAEGEKTLYLTFDDGPVPEYTPFVLKTLQAAGDVKATFFCVGENIAKNPSVFHEVLAAGHAVGNHTYNHLKGWQTEQEAYLQNVQRCQEVMMKEGAPKKSGLFRPPYGRIRGRQARDLTEQGYQIVMWTVLSVDYDQRLDREACLRNSLKATRPGSIVVFHDSEKAYKNLSWVLPRYIEAVQQEGYLLKCF